MIAIAIVAITTVIVATATNTIAIVTAVTAIATVIARIRASVGLTSGITVITRRLATTPTAGSAASDCRGRTTAARMWSATTVRTVFARRRAAITGCV